MTDTFAIALDNAYLDSLGGEKSDHPLALGFIAYRDSIRTNTPAPVAKPDSARTVLRVMFVFVVLGYMSSLVTLMHSVDLALIFALLSGVLGLAMGVVCVVIPKPKR